MNEAETRAELIDPKLKADGWGVIEDTKILREHNITKGKIQTGGRAKKLTADYVLVYKGIKLAVIEAKSNLQEVGEGVAQAKQYAEKLDVDTTFSTNGKEIYSICMRTGAEGLVDNYPSPEELWDKKYNNIITTDLAAVHVVSIEAVEAWREKFCSIPFDDCGGTKSVYYYQELAINKTLEAIANNQHRILLTLATGTGKTFIAFQIAWKLFHSRWNIQNSSLGGIVKSRIPRILFLADRNILADQAYNAFSSFPEDALIRIKPSEIRKKGSVPTNGSIFFTIFQTFMSGTDTEGKPVPYFGEYPKDFFDLIIIDECHRGGANDESTWRAILEYFSPAFQLGLTATPKRKDNIDTYQYFGEPVYIYSLKEGINDGFLTPFKVKRIKTTIDDYQYTNDDAIIEGEIQEGKIYKEADFNRIIEIKAREAKRVQIFLDEANPNDKSIVFCANQAHAALIRDLINQYKKDKSINYCVRVTANDGEIGEQFLREFQDNEKTIPTILTTSQKLSTGVDARNIRNIVLLRPIKQIIEFKQIIGRGSRLFDGKEFFTIYDYVDAYHHFADPEWDGEPIAAEVCKKCGQSPCVCEIKPPKPCEICGQLPCICIKEPTPPCYKCGKKPCECIKKVKIKLKDGKEIEIQHMLSTYYYNADGTPISAEDYFHSLFGSLPDFFKTEAELRTIWSNPLTRKIFLAKLAEAGYGKDELYILQQLISAEKSDIYDVLEYVFNSTKPITREARVAAAQSTIFALLNERQKEFIEFVLSKYIETGVEELDQDKLPFMLNSKYHSFEDASLVLGDLSKVKELFIEFQKYLYEEKIA